MNANVNPVVATIVVLLAIAAGGIWMWTGGKAAEIGGPAKMAISPSGHLFIQMQNRLLEHDASGAFIAEHDLAKIDTDVFLGGFDFFSDGTMLMRRGPDPRTFGDNLRSFQRRDNLRSLQPVTQNSGMARCDTTTWQCTTFGPEPIDFGAAISVLIDRSSDTVYISDTTRHLLRKYSATGEPLAPPASGFRFPNSLELVDGQLFLADTNHHVVRQVEPGSEEFGQTVASHDVIPNLAMIAGRRWPSHLTRVGDEWWVNVMKHGMNEGEIYIFDNDWSYLRRVRLPGDADPIAQLAFGNEVLVSDWNNDVVYRVSTEGELLGEFASTGLKALVEESAAERKRYRVYGYAGVANILLLIGILIAKGTDWRGAKTAPQPKSTERPGEPVVFEPAPENLRKFTMNLRVAAILLVAIVVILGLILGIIGTAEMAVQLLLPVLAIVGVYALMLWFRKAVASSSIRFDVNRITLRDHTGREVSSPYHAVRYSGAAVTAGELAVFLGQPQMPIYDRDALIATLSQRVPADARISEFRMQMKLIAIRHPQGMLTVFTLLAAVVVGGTLLVYDILR